MAFVSSAIVRRSKLRTVRALHSFAFKDLPTRKRVLWGSLGLVGTGAAALLYSLETSVVEATDLELHAPHFHWDHSGLLSTFNHESLRRGYQVYKQVCAACHALSYIHYRNLVGVTHTVDEAKAEAAAAQFEDGPDEEGNMFMRPGKLSDKMPKPYKNDEAARAANNGALPPDLMQIVLGRHDHENYVFSLLTGYTDAPAGVTVGEGQAYNPYFPGGLIGMPQQIYEDSTAYEDGTKATVSQQAKDVTEFLAWCASPELDTKKRYALKAMIFAALWLPFIWYLYRRTWQFMKARKVQYIVPQKARNRYNSP